MSEITIPIIKYNNLIYEENNLIKEKEKEKRTFLYQIESNKKAKIELQNVQSMVEKIKEDFNLYFISNDKLRKLIQIKKEKLSNCLSKINECCGKIGRLSGQVSIYEHRLDNIIKNEKDFEEKVDELLINQVKDFFDDIESLLLFLSQLEMETKFLSLVVSPFEEEVKIKTEKFYQTKEKYTSLHKKKIQLNESNKLLLSEIENLNIELNVYQIKIDQYKNSCLNYESDIENANKKEKELQIIINDLKLDIDKKISIKSTNLTNYNQRYTNIIEHLSQLKIELCENENNYNEKSIELKDTILLISQKSEELNNIVQQQENDTKIMVQFQNEMISLNEKSKELETLKNNSVRQLNKNLQILTNLDDELIHIRQLTRTSEDELLKEVDRSKETTSLLYELKNQKFSIDLKLKQIESVMKESILIHQNQYQELNHNISVLEYQIKDEMEKKNHLENDIILIKKRRLELNDEIDKETLEKSIILEYQSLSENKRLQENDNDNLTQIILSQKKEFEKKINDLKESISKLDETKSNILEQKSKLTKELNDQKSKSSLLKKITYEPTKDDLEHIEREVNKLYEIWEEEEISIHNKKVFELQEQLTKLEGGHMILFPDLFLTRSHELAKLRGILTQLKHEKNEIGLANLVSHIETKISNPIENINENFQQVDTYQSIPSLILSPLPKRQEFSPVNILFPSNNIQQYNDSFQIHSNSGKKKNIKIRPSSTSTSTSTIPNKIDKRKSLKQTINEPNVIENRQENENEKNKEKDKDKIDHNKEQKKTSLVNTTKKKNTKFRNDWLFDDADLSLCGFIGRK